jgi:hypothetical protein
MKDNIHLLKAVNLAKNEYFKFFKIIFSFLLTEITINITFET